MKALKELQKNVNVKEQELRDARGAWNAAAHQVAPEEWLEEIQKIDNPVVKVQVASLVWWDYIADKLECKSGSDIYQLASEWKKDIHGETKLGRARQQLVRMGFPKDMAARRTKLEIVHAERKRKEVPNAVLEQAQD